MKENDPNKKTCSTSGCSTNHIWIGIVLILIIMITAFIFGK